MPVARAHVAKPLAGLVFGLCLLCFARIVPALDELDYGFEERVVGSVEISGNLSFDEARLKSLLPFGEPRWYLPFRVVRYTPDQLQIGIDTIRDFYRDQGYHEVQVVEHKVERDREYGDRIEVSVQEGPRTRIGRVRFLGSPALEAKQLLGALVHPAGSPAPYLTSGFGRDVYALRAAHRARGYLACRVDMLVLPREGAVDVSYTIVAGPRYTVSAVTIEGFTEVRREHIERELRVHPGDVFRLDSIARTEEELFETGWFRDVSFNTAALDTAAATCVLRLRVVERPKGFYEFGVGAGDEEQLRFAAAWGDKNLFRSGRGLTARGRIQWGLEDVLEEGRKVVLDFRQELVYRHPRLFGSRLDVGLSTFFSRESRGELGVALERLGMLGNTTLYARGFESAEFELASQYVRKVVLDAVPAEQRDEVAGVGLNRSITNSATLVFTHDTRNSPFLPRSGRVWQLLLQSAGGPVFRGDNSFHKAIGSVVDLVPLSRRTVLALRAQAGWTGAWYDSADAGAAGVPLEDRFFAGGRRSVRGYRENSLGPGLTDEEEATVIDDDFLLNRPAAGGNAQLLLNAELRLPLPLLSRWGFGLNLFADGGNVWEDWTRVRAKQFRLRSDPGGSHPTTIFDFRTSIGAGLRYNTPVGPLRLEYGLPLKRALRVGVDGETDETDPHHIWHFSLGHAF